MIARTDEKVKLGGYLLEYERLPIPGHDSYVVVKELCDCFAEWLVLD